MYVLYGGRYTRSLLVEMVLTEGGIPYEVREVDYDPADAAVSTMLMTEFAPENLKLPSLEVLA